MARGDRIKAGMQRRLLESSHELTVHYAPVRLAATAPVSGAPYSPLSGPRPSTTIVPVTGATAKPARTIRCLWQEAPYASNARPNGDRVAGTALAWVEGAAALAIVSIDDAALDSLAPFGATLFDGAQYIEHRGKRFNVVQVDTAAPSFADPHSYTVWLSSARVQ